MVMEFGCRDQGKDLALGAGGETESSSEKGFASYFPILPNMGQNGVCWKADWKDLHKGRERK